MPLYLREKRLHHPDDYRLKRFTDSGYVPSIRRSEEHRLDWGGSFTDWFEGGTVDTVDEAKTKIALAFRCGIARVGVAELADAKPGPPVCDPAPEVTAEEQIAAPYGDHNHLPVVIHNPRRLVSRPIPAAPPVTIAT